MKLQTVNFGWALALLSSCILSIESSPTKSWTARAVGDTYDFRAGNDDFQLIVENQGTGAAIWTPENLTNCLNQIDGVATGPDAAETTFTEGTVDLGGGNELSVIINVNGANDDFGRYSADEWNTILGAIYTFTMNLGFPPDVQFSIKAVPVAEGDPDVFDITIDTL